MEGKMGTIKRVILVLLLCTPAFADYTVRGNLRVDGGDIGIETDTDLLQLADDFLTVSGTVKTTGDLRVDGGDIGLTVDTDLIQIASGVATVNGELDVTGAITGGSLVINTTDLVVDAVNHRVGIGTANPGATLEMQSSSPVLRLRDTGATASATAAFVEFGGTDAAIWSRTGYVGDASSGDTDIYLEATVGDLHLGDSSGISVLNLQGGNVGIGLTTVDTNYKLIIRRAANVNLGIGLQSYELAIAAFNDALSANIPMRFYASEFNLLNGNVGINEIAPSHKLDVVGVIRTTSNLLVDGGDIGLTTDTDLIQMANGVLTVNGELDATGAVTFNHIDDCNGLIDVANDGGMSEPGDDTKVVAEQAIVDYVASKITLGDDLVVNGDFGVDDNWTKWPTNGDLWQITGGNAVYYADGAGILAPTYAHFYTDAEVPGIQDGSMYLLEFKIIDWAGENWGEDDGISVLIGANGAASQLHLTDEMISGNGTYKYYFTFIPFADEYPASALQAIIYFTVHVLPAGGAVGDEYGFKIDYVTLKKIRFFGSN